MRRKIRQNMQTTTFELPRELYKKLVAEADRRGCWQREVIVDALVRALTTQPGQQVA